MSKLMLTKRILLTIFVFGFLWTGITQFVFADTLTDSPLPSFNVISLFVDSNRYTHEKSDEIAVNQQIINPDALELTTDFGSVYLDESSLSFQIENDNGYLWSTTINTDDPSFSNSFIQRAKSAIIIESFNTISSNYAITEENLFTQGTSIDTTLIHNGFSSNIRFGKSSIALELVVTFEQDSILVEIPQESINESGNFKISSIKVYPYFGAVKAADVPGYIFIPDGAGALIDYKFSDPLVNNNYQKEIYDRNIGYNTEINLNQFTSGGTHVYAPVFGFVHGVNQNGVFANIISGSEYGLLNVYFPARTRGFTTVFSEFVFRKTYRQPIDKVGNTISLLQTEANNIDIKIQYDLLSDEDANYVGMAKTYRDYLETNVFSQNPETDTNLNIPLKIDTIGIEKTQGVLFSKSIMMTDFAAFIDILEDLQNEGIDNIIANYQGFTSNGLTWSPPNYTKVASRLGSTKELEMIQSLTSDLYFVSEYMKASSRSSGYNQYFDLAKKINDQLYQYGSLTDTKYLLEYQQMEQSYRTSLKDLQKYPITGLSIQSMGNLLYDDFSNHLYRNDLITLMQTLLQESDLKIALSDVNSYLWGQINAFYDFPMYSSQYVTFDDTVPFLSIALSNHVDLFGPDANFYPYARDELLRLIDYGVYPSFILTNESPKLLEKTSLESIYSSKYQDLKLSVITYYNYVNDALKYVKDAQISERNIIGLGVVEIVYDNEYAIIVNYSNSNVTYQSQLVEPKGYLVYDMNPLDD